MKVTFRGPENEIITYGYGPLKKGEPKEISNPKYAYDLCATGRCDPSDEASKTEYAAMREQELSAAAAAGKPIYCDQCLSEVNAKTLKESGCPRCPKPPQAEPAPELIVTKEEN